MSRSSVMVGLLVAAALGAAGPAIAEPRNCPPGALVEGDPAVAQPVREHLASAGVGEAPADCPAVRARVARDGDEIAVVVLDADGRSSGRRLADPLIAATWIESWVSPESAPLLAPRHALAAPGAVDVAAPAAQPPPSVLWLGVATRSLNAGDGSDWRSIDASACARLGPACVGVAGAVAENDGWSHNGGMSLARRRTIDLAATGRLPARLGKATLAPSASLGIGWLRTQRDEGEQQYEPDPNCQSDPTFPDNMCPGIPVPPYVIGDGFEKLTFGMRAQLAASLSLPITEQVAVELSAGIDLVPTAHSQPFVHPMYDYPDDGDPNTQDQPPDGGVGLDPITELPGEPGYFTWWGIGLRVGAW